MTQMNIHDAKSQLSKLIEKALQGDEVIIAKAGKPVVRLCAIEPVSSGRQFGSMKGRAELDERFFEPLPEAELEAWE